MNEITVNRTDRRTDTPKENPFLDRKSNYSVSSPKTPRMQKRHKELEKELLETPKIKESQATPLTVTADEIVELPIDHKTPKQFLDLCNFVFELADKISLEFGTKHGRDVRQQHIEDSFEFDIKFHGSTYADWMEDFAIDENAYWDAVGETLSNFVEELKIQYDWIEDWSQAGRSGGWLILRSKPIVSRAKNETADYPDTIELIERDMDQEYIDDSYKETKQHFVALTKLEFDLNDIKDKIATAKQTLMEHMKTKEFWIAQGLDVPEDKDVSEWEERWHKRSSVKTAELEGKQIVIYFGKNGIEPDGKGVTKITVDGTEMSPSQFYNELHEDIIAQFPEFIDEEVTFYIGNATAWTYDIMFDAQPEVDLDKYDDFLMNNYNIKFVKTDEDPDVDMDVEDWENRWHKRSSLKKKARVFYFHGDQHEDGKMVSYKVEADDVHTAEDIARIVAQEHGMGLAGGMQYDEEPSEAVIYESTHVTPEMIGSHQEEQRVIQEEQARTRWHHQGANPIAEYNENDAYSDSIQYYKEEILEYDFIFSSDPEIMEIYEQHKDDEQGFWNEIKANGLEDELNRLIEQHVQNDYDVMNSHAENFLEELGEAMREVAEGDTWIISGENIGWRNLSVKKEFEIKIPQDLVDIVTPRSGDYTMKVWKHQFEEPKAVGLYIRVSHHDSPMGESYYCLPTEPTSIADADLDDWEERWHKRSGLTVVVDSSSLEEPVNPAPVGRAIDRLHPIPNLWYENDKGERLYPDLKFHSDPNEFKDMGYKYQNSRFPVLRDSVCTDEGRIMDGETTINCIEPIVIYLVTQMGWKLPDAITVGATACERCMNILLEETTGEPYEGRDTAGTHCEICEMVDPEYDAYYKEHDDTRERILEEENESLIKESSMHNDIQWKAMKLALKYTVKADERYPEFQSNSFVIFTQDAKFRMDQLDAMGEIKENMVGKVKKVNDESLSIEIGKQTYEVPLVDAFKVMKPFTAQIVVDTENDQNTPQDMAVNENEGWVEEEVAEEQPMEGEQVRPEISMERDEFAPMPIKSPQKPAEKALSVETTLKNMMKKLGRTLEYGKEVLPRGTKITITVADDNFKGTIDSRVQGGYQVILDDGRKFIIEDEMISDVNDQPVYRPPDPPSAKQPEKPNIPKEDIPVGSEVWVNRGTGASPQMSRGIILEKNENMFRVRTHNGEIVDTNAKNVTLEKLPETENKLPFTPYRYSKRGLYPLYSIDHINNGMFVYASERGMYILGRVIGKQADTVKVDLIDGEQKDFDKSDIYLQQLPQDMRGSMMDRYNKWISEAVVVESGSMLKTAEYEHMTIQTSDIPNELKDQIEKVQDGIDKDKLYDGEDEDGWVEGGLQKLFHTTILYGVNPKDESAISEKINKVLSIEPLRAVTSDIEYFDNEEEGYTAMVLRLESEGLTKLHDALKEEFDNKDSYPEYKPHVTIAYLKHGERVDGIEFAPFEWEVDGIEMSQKDGSLVKIAEEKPTCLQCGQDDEVVRVHYGDDWTGWECERCNSVVQTDDEGEYCIDCGDFIDEQEVTDISLCSECMEDYDVDRLWRDNDEGRIDALSFNESETVRDKYRHPAKPQEKDTDEWEERWHKRSGLTKKSITKVAESVMDNYIEYLEDTLIPDLKESGSFETAKDFEYIVEVLETKLYDPHFVSYLRETLIPDLTSEGMDATANDLKEGLEYIERYAKPEDKDVVEWEERWHKRSDKGVVGMERVILGSVEISDQMLNKDGMWLSRDLWEPELKYRVDQIEQALGQIERGVNVTAQIRSFVDDLDEILEKIPADQVQSAQDYISDQLSAKPEVQAVIGNYIGKTAGDVTDKPFRELNNIIKENDDKNVKMQNPDGKGKDKEPNNTQPVQQDVNIDARSQTLAMKRKAMAETYRVDTMFFPDKKMSVAESWDGTIGGDQGDVYFQSASYDEENNGVTLKNVELSTTANGLSDDEVNDIIVDIVYRSYDSIGEDTFAGKSEAGQRVAKRETKPKSEFPSIEADIKSGFRQIIDEIEKSNNPYVVSEIGKKLYKQQQSDNKVVREGNVSRILP